MLLGLRTVIYPVTDLAAAKAWYTELLGREPYFEQPFYVGFDVGGYELGLDPNGPTDGARTYWGVSDIEAAMAALRAAGAETCLPIEDVGDGIRLAGVIEPGGAFLGVIENPHNALPDRP